MVSEKEIFKAACVRNEEQEGNSIIRVEAKILHLKDGGSEETLSELTLDGPCVSIHRSFRYTVVDLQFDDDTDPDYIRLSDMLREFTVPDESMDVENDRIPALILTVVPRAYDGEYFICGMHGTWCLMPSDMDRPADMVRFIFDNDLLHAYQVNADELISDEYDEDTDDTEDAADNDDSYGYLTGSEETEGSEYEEA